MISELFRVREEAIICRHQKSFLTYASYPTRVSIFKVQNASCLFPSRIPLRAHCPRVTAVANGYTLEELEWKPTFFSYMFLQQYYQLKKKEMSSSPNLLKLMFYKYLKIFLIYRQNARKQGPLNQILYSKNTTKFESSHGLQLMWWITAFCSLDEKQSLFLISHSHKWSSH